MESLVNDRSYFYGIPNELFPFILSYLNFLDAKKFMDVAEIPKKIDNCDIYLLMFKEKYFQISDITSIGIIDSYEKFYEYLEDIDIPEIVRNIKQFEYFILRGKCREIVYKYAMLKVFPEVIKSFDFTKFGKISDIDIYHILCYVKREHPHLLNKITQNVLIRWCYDGIINIKDIE